ncbi:MAG: PQQ-binding-like beta-propeller repeat protein [Melioribacteraceae bacterium]
MNKWLIILALFLASCFTFAQTSSFTSQINFLANPQHTSFYQEEAVASSPEVKFIFETKGAVRSTPAIHQNKIYFGSGDSHLYCIDETIGNEIWKYKTGGAVTSSPYVVNNKLYFSSKDGFLYCLNSSNGKLIWKFNLGKELFYKWEFDYYLSSPTVADNVVYIGSGDGNLYAVNSNNGKLLWKYFAGSRIRSTPAIASGILYFGDFAGKLYAIDLKSHKPKWIYETDGVKINIEEFLFDRSALVSSPTVYKDVVLVGSREGFLYCVDIETGKLNWKYDHKVSWVISTPAIYKENVIVGTSDGHFVNSVNIKTGVEDWRYKTKTPVWTTMAIASGVVYGGDYSGNFFALNAESGKELWNFKTGDRIHGSPVVKNGVVYFGADDGNMYAIGGSKKFSDRNEKFKKAVYWEESKVYNYFSNKTDEFIRDYFIREGYELVDGEKLKSFIEDRNKDHLPSVVVFAKNDFPKTIVNDSTKTDLLREFLKGDNRAVLLGENPLAYIKDHTGKLVELDYRKASKYFGIDYGGELTEAMKGLIPDYVTEEGVKIGLKGFRITMASVNPHQVSKVYALDENGRAALWLKNYGGPANSGLVQLWVDWQLPNALNQIKNAAEFGLK